MKRPIRAVLGLLVGFAAALPLVTLASTAAHAQTVTGYIEICKAADPASQIAVPTNIPFKFTWSGGWTTVDAGSCTGKIAIYDASSVTITEASAPWYAVSGIAALNSPSSYLTASSLSAQTATVSVSPTSISAVQFTNKITPGYLEVCKTTAAGDTLSGPFSFTLTGVQDTSFSVKTTVNVASCSDPIAVPAGQVQVVEGGNNLNVTSITATRAGGSTNALASSNAVTGTAVVNVVAGAQSTGSVVTYQNDTVTLKICKQFDGTPPTGVTTFNFPWTATNASVGVGPVPASGTTPVTIGTCSVVGHFAPGSSVSIAEAIVPGTKVETISPDTTTGLSVPATQPTDAVNPDAINRSVTVVIGTPINSSASAPDNEAIVNYENKLAQPGDLKICKNAGTTPGAPIGTTFMFQVSGVTNPVSVVLGQCSIVGGSTNPVLFPYNSTVTVTELPSTGNAVFPPITVSPALVTETRGTTTESNPTAFSNTSGPAGGPAGLGYVSVLMSEQAETDVTFTDVDPPVVSSNPVVITSGNTVTIAGSAAEAATVTASLPAASSSSVSLSPTTISNGVLVEPPSVLQTFKQSISKLTTKQRHALLLKEEKSLSSLNSKITNLDRQLKHTHAAAQRKAINNKLTTASSEKKLLLAEIKLLK